MAQLLGSFHRHDHAPHKIDHLQLLSSLFIAWGIVMAAAAWLILSPFGVTPVPFPKTFTMVLSIVTMLFVVTGLQLRHADGRFRSFALVLSVLALFAFPVGTALGAYGLYVLTRVWTAREARSREPVHEHARARVPPPRVP